MSKHRDVSWILQQFRRVLLGREWTTTQLRHKQDISSRSPPHPLIPGGPAHKLSNNSYVQRDTRRLVTPPKDYVNVLHEGKKIEAKVGLTLMSAAVAAGVDIEAACDGNCACSTCHVYIDEKYFDKLPKASDDEEDMLDLALFLQPTSRLGCQIVITPQLDGMDFKLPSATRNFYANRKEADQSDNDTKAQ